MMKNYLKFKYHIFYGIFLFIILFVFQLFLIGLFLIVLYLLILLLFRQKRIYTRDHAQLKEGGVFTPINGKVRTIQKNISHPLFGENLSCIEFFVFPWSEYGIYFPVNAEILDFYVRGKSMFEITAEPLAQESIELESGLAFTFELGNQDKLSLQFPKSLFGIFPKIKVMPGDRGKINACLGHFPLGGKVLLYLPEKYEILVSSKDKLIAGETLIAGRPEFSP